MFKLKKTFFAASLLLLFGCQTVDKNEMLIGKWQAVELESPQLDSLMDQQRNFLDTFGRNTTSDENIMIYGFANIDSAREALLKEMDDYSAMQEHAVKNTWFDFKDKSQVVMNFSGQKDTAKWKINDAGKLELNSTNKDQPETISIDILQIEDTLLKLYLENEGMGSTVIFKPSKS